MDLKTLVTLFVSVCMCSCMNANSPPSSASLSSITMAGTDGQSHLLGAEFASAPATVFVFFDPQCPCMAAHQARLRALHDAFAPRAVRWFMVDSEVGGSIARDQSFVAQLNLDYPMLFDQNAVFARAVGAQFASFAVVVDRQGVVRYAGGIDDDRSHLRDDATMYLKDALTDMLDGTPVRRAEGKTLGCALPLW